LLLALKTNFIYSDYDYASITAQLVQTHPLAKLELRSRFFATYISGSNVAPESQVYLAGANPEEQADSKFNRSAGLVPAAWSRYGEVSNHYQVGGGLNLRGYAGYLIPVADGASQSYLYRGNGGASVNLELDYDKYIPFRAGSLSKYFHIDAYLFFDAGILTARKLTNLDQTQIKTGSMLNTGFMASGGHGLILTIKKWGVLDEIKPLSIRFDIPFYLSNAQYAASGNVQFRWVLGVQRSF
jgi:aminopeptidase N